MLPSFKMFWLLLFLVSSPSHNSLGLLYIVLKSHKEDLFKQINYGIMQSNKGKTMSVRKK